jgi:hypothetical protein
MEISERLIFSMEKGGMKILWNRFPELNNTCSVNKIGYLPGNNILVADF